jgi:hypothetical protein
MEEGSTSSGTTTSNYVELLESYVNNLSKHFAKVLPTDFVAQFDSVAKIITKQEKEIKKRVATYQEALDLVKVLKSLFVFILL